MVRRRQFVMARPWRLMTVVLVSAASAVTAQPLAGQPRAVQRPAGQPPAVSRRSLESLTAPGSAPATSKAKPATAAAAAKAPERAGAGRMAPVAAPLPTLVKTKKR